LEVQFSGIIPAYNHERFIYSAIASLAEQVDEVVVVDDNSSDKTWMEIERAKQDFPNVRSFLNTQNLGVSGCVNRAVQVSKGNLLFFLGSDDEAIQGRVKKQAELLENPGILVSTSIPEIIGERGLSLTSREAPEFRLPKNPKRLPSELFFEGNFICAPSIAMKRANWDQLQGYRRGLPNLHDYDFLLRSTSIGSIHISPEPFVRYRKHSLNLSTRELEENTDDRSMLSAEKDFILASFIDSSSRKNLVEILSLGNLTGSLLSQLDRQKLVQVAIASNPFVRNSPPSTRSLFEQLIGTNPLKDAADLEILASIRRASLIEFGQ
jgi:glycosyltransferase involved in cell wall biosynthesis